MSSPDLAGVVVRHAESLMAVPGVIGVAEGEHAGTPCVLVLVRRKTSEIVARVPAVLEGIPTDILETGAPEAFERY